MTGYGDSNAGRPPRRLPTAALAAALAAALMAALAVSPVGLSAPALPHEPEDYGEFVLDDIDPPAALDDPAPLNNTARGVIRSDLVQSRGIIGAGDLSDGVPGRQVVAVTDTGVYWGHECYSRPGKQAAFIDIAGDGGWSDGDGTGHGTHIAGTVLGDAPTHDLWNKYDGHAFGADYVAVKAFTNSGYWAGGSDYYGVWLAAYDADARVNTNAWGAASGGAYSAPDQHADAVCWDYRDYLLCCRAGIGGASGPNTIDSPAVAKNVISCGVTYTADPTARPVWSGRGPTDDGRIKPDVCAPGVDIVSAKYGTVDQYMVYSGCASATAAVSGAAALVRDYYMLGYYPTGVKSDSDAFTPSAALIKATLINGAVELTGGGADDNGEGVYPNNSQGWGRVHLDNALYFAGDDRRLKVWDGPADLDTGQAWTGTYVLGAADRGLKVTLAYTDYPGASLANDLSLEVTAPDGTVFRGNNFSGLNPGYSCSGGTFDAVNNVEGVHLIPGYSFPFNLPTGTYTIKVYGTNVPYPYSDFAVVVGEFACQAPPPVEDVALMGDYGTQLRNLLTGAGYTVRSYGGSDYAAVTAHLVNHKVVLLHRVTSEAGLDSLRAEAARQEKGLVFLSSYTVGSHAMGVLSTRYSDPAAVAHNWAGGPVRLRVEAVHPVFSGYSVGDVITVIDGGDNDYQSYDGWSGTNIGSNQMESGYPWFIGVKDRAATGGAKWVVMGSFGACAYTGMSAWTADGRQILCNAVDWAMAPQSDQTPREDRGRYPCGPGQRPPRQRVANAGRKCCSSGDRVHKNSPR